jgi:hypothetical protein
MVVIGDSRCQRSVTPVGVSPVQRGGDEAARGVSNYLQEQVVQRTKSISRWRLRTDDPGWSGDLIAPATLPTGTPTQLIYR